MSNATRKYICDCSARCVVPTEVGRSTYYNHAPYRNQLNVSFGDFAALSGQPNASVDGSRGISLGHEQARGSGLGVLEDVRTSRKRQRVSGFNIEGSEGHNSRTPSADGMREPSSPIPDNIPHPQEENEYDTPCGSQQPNRNTEQHGDYMPPPQGGEQPPGLDPDVPEATAVCVAELRTAIAFVDGLKSASLDDEDLDAETLERLRNPPEGLADSIDPDLRLAIDLFLSASNASEENYTSSRKAFLRRHPEDDILTYARIKTKIAELTGIVPLVHDMCINSCLAFTGPFAQLSECPTCNEPRFDPRTELPRQQFHTIPIGPQLQALWRSAEGAKDIRHRSQRTTEILEQILRDNGVISVYDDIYHGRDYLSAVERGDIGPDDMVLMLSIDGAQLYAKKQSDCWISIWIILDHAPDARYMKKHVVPGTFIPGPNKPKNVDSFLYPSLHHLAALQKEGLKIWDAQEDRVFTSYPYLALATADGPGMTYLNGLVGHQGAFGCRLYCPMKGRHKPGANHYYPALLCPDNYSVEGCDHDDIDPRHIPLMSVGEYTQNLTYIITSPNDTQYKKRRRETGISKPSIFSGLPSNRMLGIPGCFPADLMHLVSLNLTDLFLSLWRGTLECEAPDSRAAWDWSVLQGEVWKAHGKRVADATPYLPGSFDRPPRNPAEKISSGYKAWEYLIYVFALGPGVFLGVLPDKYWTHFCKLVAAIRLIHQRSITSDQLRKAHTLLIEFVEAFETLYYQRKITRLHFCRQSLHALLHLAPEACRVGPQVYYTQWTMERTIGNLGEEIKQPSNPFANLSQRGLRRSQVNALKAIIPDLEPDSNVLPRGSRDLGNGFILLRARDITAREIDGRAGEAIRKYYQEQAPDEFDPNSWPHIIRWARLRLPNGQIARSAWKEKLKPMELVRMARNVKLQGKQQLNFGEVQFFFRVSLLGRDVTLVLLSLYSPPDKTLYRKSHETLWSCTYRGDAGFVVFDAKEITSVVAMVPLDNEETGRYFVTEKLGLEVAFMGGMEDDLADNTLDDNDNL